MAVYVFPKSVGVTPHRCNRFSIVEFTIDELVFFGWAICGIKMALFGECIGSITQALAPLCSEWTIGIIVSFAASAAYMITGYMAARNLQQKTSDHSVMFARGAWI